MPSPWLTGIKATLPHVQRLIQEGKAKKETRRLETKEDVLRAQGLRLQAAKEKRDRALAALQAEYARKQSGEELGVKKGYLELGWAQHLGLGKPKKTGGKAETPSKYPQWYARSVKDFEDIVVDAGYSLETRDQIEAVLQAHSANPLEARGEIDKILRNAPLIGEAASTEAAIGAARGTVLNAATYLFSTLQLGSAYGQEEIPGFVTSPEGTTTPVSVEEEPVGAEGQVVRSVERPLGAIERTVRPQESTSEMAPDIKAQEIAGVMADNPEASSAVLAQYGNELRDSGLDEAGINRILTLADSIFRKTR